jgi:hypothetical protein
MTRLTDFPLLVFAISLVGLYLWAQIGAALGRRRPIDTLGVRGDFDVINAGTLTLLGLIIGFSFSMAISRYDQRKNYEEAEANAIGTGYVRASLLPAADGTTVRTLLRKYLRSACLVLHDPRYAAAPADQCRYGKVASGSVGGASEAGGGESKSCDGVGARGHE